GTYVRDKDAVVASMLIAEMASYYHQKGITLLQRMQALYEEFGFYRNALVNVAFEGEQGMLAMKKLMTTLREQPPTTFAGRRVLACADYAQRLHTDFVTETQTPLTLPASNVLSYELEGGAGLIIRPSGTEPKIKGYITVVGDSLQAAAEMEDCLRQEAEALLKA
ncbi:MAG: hypothetical protein IIX61_03855, partial [Loktanella sp.]|nr:hypothetical protein [Loktanella sp.]